MHKRKSQLSVGTQHEREHTRSFARAKKIAQDHLREDPKYYTHLLRMEKLVKSGKWNPPHKKKMSAAQKGKQLARFRKLTEKIYQLAIMINKYGQKAYHLNKRAARPKYLRTAKGQRWRQEAKRLYKKADQIADKIERLEELFDEDM